MCAVVLRSAALLGAAIVLAPGCGREPREAGPSSGGVAIESPSLAAPRDGGGEHRGRGRASREPAVRVDGVVVSALTYRALPATLPAVRRTRVDGRRVRRFRVADLLESLGVDLGAVRQVRLRGGRDRVSIIDGAELARVRADLLFSFTRGERGKPRIHYPDGPMAAGSRVDLVEGVDVYVRCEPPPAGRGPSPLGMRGVPGAREHACARVGSLRSP